VDWDSPGSESDHPGLVPIGGENTLVRPEEVIALAIPELRKNQRQVETGRATVSITAMTPEVKARDSA